MKRNLFCCLLLFVAVFFCGCDRTSIEEFAKNNISEISLNYFVGSTENFSITMSSGLREDPYTIDGVSNDLVKYCVLSIVPKNGISTFGAEYTVEINSDTLTGVFENSPFDKSLASDLETSLNDEDEIYVYIILNNETEIAKMTCISSSFEIKQTDAINLAIDFAREKLIALSDDKKKQIEGYSRIITTDRNLEIYFWYVSFVNTDGETVAMVIDPSSGEIVADM